MRWWPSRGAGLGQLPAPSHHCVAEEGCATPPLGRAPCPTYLNPPLLHYPTGIPWGFPCPCVGDEWQSELSTHTESPFSQQREFPVLGCPQPSQQTIRAEDARLLSSLTFYFLRVLSFPAQNPVGLRTCVLKIWEQGQRERERRPQQRRDRKGPRADHREQLGPRRDAA